MVPPFKKNKTIKLVLSKKERRRKDSQSHKRSCTLHTYGKRGEGDTGRGRGAGLEDKGHHIMPCDVGKSFGRIGW